MHKPRSGRTVRARNRRRRGLVVLAALAGAIALGATAGSAPSGVGPVDRALAGAFAGVVAYAGRRARRWTLFIPAGVGASLAATGVGLACGVGAIALATANGWRRRRSGPLGVAAAGLAAAALLRMGDVGPHGLSAVLGAAGAAPVVVSGYRLGRRWERRVARLAVAVAVAVVVAAGVGAGVALLDARDEVSAGRRALDAGLDAARQGDADGAAERLRRAAAHFDDADTALGAWWALPARALPVLGHNLRATSTATDVASDVSHVGAETVARAGAEAVRVRDGRVPVEAIAALDEPVSRALRAVLVAQRQTEIDKSDWLLPVVSGSYEELERELVDTRPDLELALDAIDRLPSLLGGNGLRRYLVLFVTPVEGRASGFPGNYAELTADDGDLEMTDFGRISDLDDRIPEGFTLDMPAEYLGRYGRFDVDREPRFITLSPHFPSVAEHARQVYAAATGRAVDGVLSVDPAAIATLLQLTGPVSIPQLDRPLTSSNAEAFLLREQYRQFADTPDRVDALESLGRATFDRLTTGNLPAPSSIANTLSPLSQAGHLRFVAFDELDGAFLDRIGVTGALEPLAGDSLAVTTTNAIGNKVDLFLQRTIDYDVEWDPDSGEVRAVAAVTLHNEAPSSGWPDNVIGNAAGDEAGRALPPGTNRTYVSVFTPFELVSGAVDGEAVAMDVERERGRGVYSTLVVIPPGGSRRLEVQLRGALHVAEYTLTVRPQLLAQPDELRVSVTTPAGRRRAELRVDRPRVLQLSIT